MRNPCRSCQSFADLVDVASASGADVDVVCYAIFLQLEASLLGFSFGGLGGLDGFDYFSVFLDGGLCVDSTSPHEHEGDDDCFLHDYIVLMRGQVVILQYARFVYFLKQLSM